MNATIQAVYLPALAQFAAKQDVRFYLCGFLIEPAPAHIGGVYLVATDDHTCCVIHDPTGESDGTYILPVPAALVSHCKPHNDDVLGDKRLSFDGKMATLSDNTGPLLAEKCLEIHGSPVNWRKVMPKMPINSDRTIQCMTLNPAYLAKAYAALKAMGIKRSSSVSIDIFPGEPGKATSFAPQTAAVHRMLFLIMPMRGNETHERLNWLCDIEPAEQEQAPAPATEQNTTTAEGGDIA